MDAIANLNFGRDSSTKFKLKLDNSKVKLAAPETSDERNSKAVSAYTAMEEPRSAKTPLANNAQFDEPRLPYYEEDYYVDSVAGFNARMLAQREGLQFDKTFGLQNLYDLESTQLKNAQMNVPMVLKLGTGQTFYMSNGKLEPTKISAEEFVKMNVNHQNTMFDGEKGGFSSLAPRRRRRGTLKGFKNAKTGN